MATVRYMCWRCLTWFDARGSAVNRAEREGRHMYCSHACASEMRKQSKTTEQKRAEKAAYDAQRRVLLADRIKA
jgi:hypothetical protein